MPPTITHLAIGERTFRRLGLFEPTDYGPFLLGCILVDVHICSDIHRRATHFAERFDAHGAYAFHKSCANFLSQLDDLLVRPWDDLARPERTFVAGYLCHLAADEEWKRFDCMTMNQLGTRWWADLDVPVTTIMIVFDITSSELIIDPLAIAAALDDAPAPDLLTHVPYPVTQRLWDGIKDHAMDGSTPESYFGAVRRMGWTQARIQKVRHEYAVHREDAVALTEEFFGGVQSRIEAMVEHALEKVPLLYQR